MGVNKGDGDYEVNQKYKLRLSRHDANFDRASDTAYEIARRKFGVDENGHTELVNGWERSTCSIAVKFLGYERVGETHVYDFEAWVEKRQDFDD